MGLREGILRAALYMPAVAAVRLEPAVIEFHQRLVGRGKRPIVSLVAVMRKLLSAIWIMIRKGETFRAELFTPRQKKSPVPA